MPQKLCGMLKGNAAQPGTVDRIKQRKRKGVEGGDSERNCAGVRVPGKLGAVGNKDFFEQAQEAQILRSGQNRKVSSGPGGKGSVIW